MNKHIALALPMLLLVACGDDTTTTQDLAKTPDDMTVVQMPDMTMPPDLAPPAKPVLGKQIERLGRPTINVAVTNPFDLDLSKANAAAKSRDATRDAYNQDSDEVNWGKNWAPVLAANLAIYDGADAVCGNQLLAGAMVAAGRYNALAGALADDRLYLDTTQTTCGFYLAVEANATLMLGLKNCGGRTPLDNVVHETYTLATVGAGGIINGGASFAVTDGVAKDGDGTASLTTFPFLADPN